MSGPLKIITLKCSSCGSSLEIHNDMERFACGYCGTEQFVERRGGTISLKLLVDGVAQVRIGTDRTAAELALVRLEKELATTEAEWRNAATVFCRENQPGSPFAVAVMVLSAIFILSAFVNVGRAGSFESVLVWVLVGIGAALLFILALKYHNNSSKEFHVKRKWFDAQHQQRIERLQQQILKEKRVIQSNGL